MEPTGEPAKLSCVLAARDAGSKAVIKGRGQKGHRCQFSQLRANTKLQRLALELLRHFGLEGSGAAAGGAGAGAAEGWQVLLYPDVAVHTHLKTASWGPVYPHDLTVRDVWVMMDRPATMAFQYTLVAPADPTSPPVARTAPRRTRHDAEEDPEDDDAPLPLQYGPDPCAAGSGSGVGAAEAAGRMGAAAAAAHGGGRRHAAAAHGRGQRQQHEQQQEQQRGLWRARSGGEASLGSQLPSTTAVDCQQPSGGSVGAPGPRPLAASQQQQQALIPVQLANGAQGLLVPVGDGTMKLITLADFHAAMAGSGFGGGFAGAMFGPGAGGSGSGATGTQGPPAAPAAAAHHGRGRGARPSEQPPQRALFSRAAAVQADSDWAVDEGTEDGIGVSPGGTECEEVGGHAHSLGAAAPKAGPGRSMPKPMGSGAAVPECDAVVAAAGSPACRAAGRAAVGLLSQSHCSSASLAGANGSPAGPTSAAYHGAGSGSGAGVSSQVGWRSGGGAARLAGVAAGREGTPDGGDDASSSKGSPRLQAAATGPQVGTAALQHNAAQGTPPRPPPRHGGGERAASGVLAARGSDARIAEKGSPALAHSSAVSEGSQPSAPCSPDAAAQQLPREARPQGCGGGGAGPSRLGGGRGQACGAMPAAEQEPASQQQCRQPSVPQPFEQLTAMQPPAMQPPAMQPPVQQQQQQPVQQQQAPEPTHAQSALPGDSASLGGWFDDDCGGEPCFELNSPPPAKARKAGGGKGPGSGQEAPVGVDRMEHRPAPLDQQQQVAPLQQQQQQQEEEEEEEAPLQQQEPQQHQQQQAQAGPASPPFSVLSDYEGSCLVDLEGIGELFAEGGGGSPGLWLSPGGSVAPSPARPMPPAMQQPIQQQQQVIADGLPVIPSALHAALQQAREDCHTRPQQPATASALQPPLRSVASCPVASPSNNYLKRQEDMLVALLLQQQAALTRAGSNSTPQQASGLTPAVAGLQLASAGTTAPGPAATPAAGAAAGAVWGLSVAMSTGPTVGGLRGVTRPQTTPSAAVFPQVPPPQLPPAPQAPSAAPQAPAVASTGAAGAGRRILVRSLSEGCAAGTAAATGALTPRGVGGGGGGVTPRGKRAARDFDDEEGCGADGGGAAAHGTPGSAQKRRCRVAGAGAVGAVGATEGAGADGIRVRLESRLSNESSGKGAAAQEPSAAAGAQAGSSGAVTSEAAAAAAPPAASTEEPIRSRARRHLAAAFALAPLPPQLPGTITAPAVGNAAPGPVARAAAPMLSSIPPPPLAAPPGDGAPAAASPPCTPRDAAAGARDLALTNEAIEALLSQDDGGSFFLSPDKLFFSPLGSSARHATLTPRSGAAARAATAAATITPKATRPGSRAGGSSLIGACFSPTAALNSPGMIACGGLDSLLTSPPPSLRRTTPRQRVPRFAPDGGSPVTAAVTGGVAGGGRGPRVANFAGLFDEIARGQEKDAAAGRGAVSAATAASVAAAVRQAGPSPDVGRSGRDARPRPGLAQQAAAPPAKQPRRPSSDQQQTGHAGHWQQQQQASGQQQQQQQQQQAVPAGLMALDIGDAAAALASAGNLDDDLSLMGDGGFSWLFSPPKKSLGAAANSVGAAAAAGAPAATAQHALPGARGGAGVMGGGVQHAQRGAASGALARGSGGRSAR